MPPVPVLVSGGLQSASRVRAAFEQTGAAGVMLARGCLGNPWLFSELLGQRTGPPRREEILDELDWIIDCACDHLGPQRAARYMRKFYPWYLERLGARRSLLDELQRVDPDRARALLRAETRSLAAQ